MAEYAGFPFPTMQSKFIQGNKKIKTNQVGLSEVIVKQTIIHFWIALWLMQEISTDGPIFISTLQMGLSS